MLFISRDKKKIDFHNTEDLREVVLSHTVRHQPGRLCTASPTVLLYEDRTRVPCEIRWLNCNVSPPKPVTGKNITFTKQDMIWDMCYVEHEGKQLLVTTRGFVGIFAYNLRTDEREWRVKGRRGGMKKEIGVESITTDGCGNLFVCGYKNASIWLFSTGGNYLATIMRHKSLDDVQPWCISWSKKMSYLLVAHTTSKDENFYVTSIKEISNGTEQTQEDAEEEAETTLHVEKFLEDLTQEGEAVTSSPAKTTESKELDISVTETVDDLERICENLLKELAEVQEGEVTTTDDSQTTVAEEDILDVPLVTKADVLSMVQKVSTTQIDDGITNYVGNLAAKLGVAAGEVLETSDNGEEKQAESEDSFEDAVAVAASNVVKVLENNFVTSSTETGRDTQTKVTPAITSQGTTTQSKVDTDYPSTSLQDHAETPDHGNTVTTETEVSETVTIEVADDSSVTETVTNITSEPVTASDNPTDDLTSILADDSATSVADSKDTTCLGDIRFETTAEKDFVEINAASFTTKENSSMETLQEAVDSETAQGVFEKAADDATSSRPDPMTSPSTTVKNGETETIVNDLEAAMQEGIVVLDAAIITLENDSTATTEDHPSTATTDDPWDHDSGSTVDNHTVVAADDCATLKNGSSVAKEKEELMQIATDASDVTATVTVETVEMELVSPSDLPTTKSADDDTLLSNVTLTPDDTEPMVTATTPVVTTDEVTEPATMEGNAFSAVLGDEDTEVSNSTATTLHDNASAPETVADENPSTMDGIEETVKEISPAPSEDDRSLAGDDSLAATSVHPGTMMEEDSQAMISKSTLEIMPENTSDDATVEPDDQSTEMKSTGITPDDSEMTISLTCKGNKICLIQSDVTGPVLPSSKLTNLPM